jgi:hypothetical protein
MSSSSGPDDPPPQWLDMSQYPNLDPDVAVAASVLSALRDILHAPGVPILPASTWIAVLREVLGTGPGSGITAPGIDADPDPIEPPVAAVPFWGHAPGSTAPSESGYPDTQYDDDHEPAVPGHADHPITWWWDPPELDLNHGGIGPVPEHPGPGPEHAG